MRENSMHVVDSEDCIMRKIPLNMYLIRRQRVVLFLPLFSFTETGNIHFGNFRNIPMQ